MVVGSGVGVAVADGVGDSDGVGTSGVGVAVGAPGSSGSVGCSDTSGDGDAVDPDGSTVLANAGAVVTAPLRTTTAARRTPSTVRARRGGRGRMDPFWEEGRRSNGPDGRSRPYGGSLASRTPQIRWRGRVAVPRPVLAPCPVPAAAPAPARSSAQTRGSTTGDTSVFSALDAAGPVAINDSTLGFGVNTIAPSTSTTEPARASRSPVGSTASTSTSSRTSPTSHRRRRSANTSTWTGFCTPTPPDVLPDRRGPELDHGAGREARGGPDPRLPSGPSPSAEPQRHHPRVPGSPLNGPTTFDVIQPP
ncbi:hypothetical protein EDF27_2319 [Curtobacterium sp. PhB136]|nr:hypothetical protein EDF27_2319 [Curtobacterium sp. PhB136]